MKTIAKMFRISAPITALSVLFVGAWLFDHSVIGVWIAAGIMVAFFASLFFSEAK